MKLLNNKIGLLFDSNHNKTLTKGLNDLDIVRADLWVHKDGDDETHTKFQENLNYLETKPQIATVTIPSANHEYNVGDKLFLHYMAYETAELTEYGWVADTDFILFQIMPDETFKMVDDVFLGEQQYTEAYVRPSGIIIHTEKKEALKVKITHTPDNHKKDIVSVGDVVITIDDKNYEFDYWGKKYIKLLKDEIVAKVANSNLMPIAL